MLAAKGRMIGAHDLLIAATAMAHVFQRAREMWSMPPDHGGAAVRIILDDPELKQRWLGELDNMRNRIKGGAGRPSGLKGDWAAGMKNRRSSWSSSRAASATSKCPT